MCEKGQPIISADFSSCSRRAMKRAFLIYIVLLGVFGPAIYLTLAWGQRSLHPSSSLGAFLAPVAPAASVSASSLSSALRANLETPLSRLLLQFVVIVAATRAVGGIFRGLGQPRVIGEMAAGILLGPSLFGWLWPEGFSFIFPTSSLGTLQLLSQVGVCLFMFIVGMELEISQLRNKAQMALVVSHASIFFPYFLGVALALWLYSNYAGPGVSFVAFALFMGIALSLTAFPVLVRILEERGLAKTFLGSMAITCAAVDDASAWAILACVIAIARASGFAATMFNVGLVILFVAVMLCLVRPHFFRWLSMERFGNGRGRGGLIAVLLMFMTASALVTETIGIHALFGAFLAGVVMPRKKEFLENTVAHLEKLSRLLLLPLFFAFSGLRTQLGLLSGPKSWLVCLAIIAVAILGKLGGTMVSARLMHLGWNDAFALGALMNTRGLVELVALNIGYDLGILSPAIFAMMVIMALATTFLTAPLLDVAEHVNRRTIRRSMSSSITVAPRMELRRRPSINYEN
jgi:Kef-type K+ transport system membrane component KefB